jgi:CBS domain-containing protein
MIVRDIMSAGVETVGPNDTLEVAARKMRERGIGALPVCEDGRPIGMLTDRDIVVRSTADGGDPRQARVRQAMTTQVVTCCDMDELEKAAATMRRHAVRRTLVLDAVERLVGIVSVDDVALRSPGLAGEILEHAREPGRIECAPPWPWRE